MRQWLKDKLGFDVGSELFIALGVLFLVMLFLWGMVYVKFTYFPDERETITLVSEDWTCTKTESVVGGFGYTGSTPFPIYITQCVEYKKL